MGFRRYLKYETCIKTQNLINNVSIFRQQRCMFNVYDIRYVENIQFNLNILQNITVGHQHVSQHPLHAT